MKADTRLFGSIDIEDKKIINLPNGIIGFPNLKKFALIYDKDSEDKNTIMWLQSMDEPKFALPVIQPSVIFQDYNPVVNDELLLSIGNLTEENLYVLVTVRVPTDITDMSVNLKAPFIINTDTMKAAQIIVENEDYQIRFPIYHLLKDKKEAGN
jgi:flagellar assembly factor FliW